MPYTLLDHALVAEIYLKKDFQVCGGLYITIGPEKLFSKMWKTM